MPAGSMDALGAFTYLSDNIPDWITRVTDLAAHTAAKHAEYTEAYKKHATQAKPRRRKNSSVCSIRTDDLLPQQQQGDITAQNTTTTTQIISDSEQPTDVDSNVNSGFDSLVSTRHNVIIHFDGHTQSTLEDMVRNIGIARNNIRRGRMSQMSPVGFRSAVPPLPGRGGPPDLMLSNIRNARSRGPPGPQNGTSAFDIADKYLEVAHGMCESAAYQFLRSGTCTMDLNNVKEKFQILLGMAGAEVRRLKEAQGQPPSEQQPKMMDTEKVKPELLSTPSVVAEPTTIKPQTSPNGSANGPIEVDDGESVSDESIDLTAIRVNRMQRMRA